MQERKSTKYLTLKRALIDKFKNENFTNGQKLPTEQELSSIYSVSRTTIRSTLDILVEEGIINKRQGSGTFFAGVDRIENNRVPGTRLVGIVNCSFMEYIYPEIITGIENTLAQNGFSLVVANSEKDRAKELQSIRRLKEQGVKGLFLEPSRSLFIQEVKEFNDLLNSLNIPVVTTHWGISNLKVSSVTVDDIEAGYEATRYLLEQGHRKIGFIFPNDNQAGHDRKIGFFKALNEWSVFPVEHYIKSYSFQEASQSGQIGYFLTSHLLSNPDRPSAIFYFNDQIAIQGYMAIYESGLKIPDDISVIGFDNYKTAEILFPPLTTFEHPKYQLGCWAARIMIDKIENPANVLPMKMVFEPQLIERKSVKFIK